MPKRQMHDHSPGDERAPYSDEGGPAGRHARTHDVRREEFTNPKGPEPANEEFALDLAERDPTGHLGPLGGHEDESVPASSDKTLHGRLQDLREDELTRLSILETGTRLEQGGTYLDLNALEQGPFTARGGQQAEPNNRYIAKRDTDYELWNRLVGNGRAREDGPSG